MENPFVSYYREAYGFETKFGETGFLVYSSQGKIWCIEEFYLFPQFRQTRRNTELFLSFCEEAKEQGITQIIAAINTKLHRNPSAIEEIHNKMGFIFYFEEDGVKWSRYALGGENG